MRRISLVILGLVLSFAGVAHLTFARADFRAQVPTYLYSIEDFIVLGSGVIEILLGLGLIFLKSYRVQFGIATAVFFVAVFPGNIAQFRQGTDVFGLDTDVARGIRLLFQPALVAWALWSTGAWKQIRARGRDAASR